MLTFGTSGIRGPVADVVTPDAVARIARATAAEGSSFALGCDGRETSPALVEAATAGLLAGGADVERLGQVPTSALAFASRDRHGFMITASHNPPEDNGIKVFAAGAEIGAKVEERIEARAAETRPTAPWDAWGDARPGKVVAQYREAVAAYLEPFGARPTERTVAVDCGTGMAATVVPDLLRSLGATVRSLNDAVDGTFPARPSKPTADTLGTLRSFVASGPAGVGLAFDGDADRLVVVDGDGAVVHEDTVVAIVAGFYTERANVDDPVVITTSNASERIDERVRAAGGRVERTNLGELSTGIARVREHGDPGTEVVFAAEPWKHLHPGFGPWIDAIVSAGLLVKLLGDRDLAELRAPIPEQPYRKTAVPCPDEHKAAVMDELDERLQAAFPSGSPVASEGIRLSLPEAGWVMVRPSGTEPKIRAYVESEEADAILERVGSIVSDQVDEHQRSAP